MAKKKSSGKVTVQFRSPTFIHKRVKYVSKEVEAAAKAGDESALQVIAELVEKGSGVIVVKEVEEPSEPTTPQAPKEPKAPKAPKATKSKASKASGSTEKAEAKNGKEAPDA